MALSAQDEVLRCTWACTISYVLRGSGCSVYRCGACFLYKAYRIFQYIIRYGYTSYEFLEVQDIFTGHYLTKVGHMSACGITNDHYFLCKAWIIERYLEHEAVELGFRERIGAFLLYRILSSQHKEW